MKIAIQGEPGSFSHEAALKLVPEARLFPAPFRRRSLRRWTRRGRSRCDSPIENSLAGSVLEHFDLLLDS